jgi:hypothetical protein
MATEQAFDEHQVVSPMLLTVLPVIDFLLPITVTNQTSRFEHIRPQREKNAVNIALAH